MNLNDYDYDLPEQLIAQHPAASRSGSRLLVVDPETGTVDDRSFLDFDKLLVPGDLLVINDTKVVPARLFGRKATGGFIELMLERLIGNDSALVLTRSSKSVREGQTIIVDDSEPVHLRVIGVHKEFRTVRRTDGGSFLDLLEHVGHVPLPPYIRRPDVPEDRERYQSVFAQAPGAVAAPTASLHFDMPFLKRLEKQGVALASLTLHVGAGTFHPIRDKDLQSHRLHQEWLRIPAQTIEAIDRTRFGNGRVVAVGTTVCRALETWSEAGTPPEYEGETDLFIMPGYSFSVVDALLTNFHLPRSSLLMLVCAFAGTDLTLSAYRHAVREAYRFYSYGDAMFIESRQDQARV